MFPFMSAEKREAQARRAVEAAAEDARRECLRAETQIRMEEAKLLKAQERLQNAYDAGVRGLMLQSLAESVAEKERSLAHARKMLEPAVNAQAEYAEQRASLIASVTKANITKSTERVLGYVQSVQPLDPDKARDAAFRLRRMREGSETKLKGALPPVATEHKRRAQDILASLEPPALPPPPPPAAPSAPLPPPTETGGGDSGIGHLIAQLKLPSPPSATASSATRER